MQLSLKVRQHPTTTWVDPLSQDGSFNLKKIVMTKFPDMGQMAKIPRLFPDLEKFLFLPNISLARGNPDEWFAETELYN